jgi:hypothetical protein
MVLTRRQSVATRRRRPRIEAGKGARYSSGPSTEHPRRSPPAPTRTPTAHQFRAAPAPLTSSSGPIGFQFALRDFPNRGLKPSRISRASGSFICGGKPICRRWAGFGRPPAGDRHAKPLEPVNLPAWYRTGRGIPTNEQTGHAKEDLPDGEAEVGVCVDDLCAGPRSGLLRFPLGNSAARTRQRVRVLVFTPALTPSLVVSRRKAWRGVIGLCRLPRIGVGVPGGAGPGSRIGLRGRF